MHRSLGLSAFVQVLRRGDATHILGPILGCPRFGRSSARRVSHGGSVFRLCPSRPTSRPASKLVPILPVPAPLAPACLPAARVSERMTASLVTYPAAPLVRPSPDFALVRGPVP